MTYETIIYEEKDEVAIITLNRPRQLNAINETLSQEIGQALDRAADDAIRVVIITGGDKVFCVGADLREPRPEKNLLQKINIRRNYRFYQKIEDLGKPVIAAIAGHCLGGGLEMAMACDLRFAADNASIGDAHSRVGTIGGAGSTVRLPRLVGIARAKEIIFTGEPIDANEAYRIGLVNKVVPIGSLMNEALKMAETLKQRPPITLRLDKMCINDGMSMPLLSALEYEQKCYALAQLSEDSKEGTQAFLEKRKPNYRGI